jgi:predicted alpha/beta-hydrolase family hydrolase
MENVLLSGPLSPVRRDVQARRFVGPTCVRRALAQRPASSSARLSPAWQVVAAQFGARQSRGPGSSR